MLRGLGSAWWLVSVVVAQTPAPDLLAKDWRERNQAARAMATAATLDLDVVFRALQLPEEGWSSQPGLYWAPRDGFDPIGMVLAECRMEANLPIWPVAKFGDWSRLVTAEDLVIPYPPARLAEWLLQQRPVLRDAVRERWRGERIVLQSRRLATLWCDLFTPSEDELLAAATDPKQRAAVVEACATARPEALRMLVLRGDGPLQDAALLADAGREASSIGDDASVRAILAQRFLETEAPHQAATLGTMLLRHGLRSLGALLEADLESPTMRRRATALAALLADEIAIPIDGMLPFLDDRDPVVVDRALCALRNPERRQADPRKLVETLLALLETNANERTATLAMTALGVLEADVPRDLADKVLARWDGTPPSLRATMLTTLLQLGRAKDIPLADTVMALRLAPSSRLGRRLLGLELASLPDGGAEALLAIRRPSAPPEILNEIAAAIASSTPDRLIPWLAQLRLRAPAMRALAPVAPHLLPPFEEVWAGVVGRSKEVGAGALAVLFAHPDAAAHHAELLPHVLAIDWREKDSFDAFVAEQLKPLAPEQRIEHLTRRLQKGEAFWLVQDLPPAVLLPHVRRWYDAATDDDRRATLCAHLVRLGEAANEDHPRILAQIRGSRSYVTLSALEKLPRLPNPLRQAIEAQIDTSLGEESSYELLNLCDVLWAHRAR